MKDRKFHLHNGQSGAAITVRITPKASRNEVSQVLEDGTILVGLTTSQHEESTNTLLIQFLSKVLNIKPTQLEIVAGLSGNDKLITIIDLDKDTVQERILQHLA